MNKKQFCSILQCALFSFDGISIEDMINRYGFRRSFAESGEELCNYLKTLKVTLIFSYSKIGWGFFKISM